MVALSTLAVLTGTAVERTFHTAPATQTVAGAVSSEPAPLPAAPLPAAPISAAPSAPVAALEFPVRGYADAPLRDSFEDRRGIRRHHALDIMAPRGTPVVAVDDGRVAKLLRNPIGGITLYQFDRETTRVYYYAHLQGYASGIVEGKEVRRGDILGFVGSTGNAPEHAPHLHFAIFELGPGEARWWKGKAVNPYPMLKAE